MVSPKLNVQICHWKEFFFWPLGAGQVLAKVARGQ